MEHEFRALVDLPGVAFYESRVFNDAEIRPDTLRAIGPRIAPSVALILPASSSTWSRSAAPRRL
jgi:maleate isomerase